MERPCVSPWTRPTFAPSRSVPRFAPPESSAARRHSPNEFQTGEVDVSALDVAQAHVTQHRDDVEQIEALVAVEVRDQPSPLLLSPAEVDGDESSARLQHAAHLAEALRAHIARKVVDHH